MNKSRKAFRKLLSVVLSVLMIFGTVAVAGNGLSDLGLIADASALSGDCGYDATWKFDYKTSTLTISGTGDMYDYSFENRPPWYNFSDYIEEIIVKVGITSIGQYAFQSFYNVTKVTLPEGITSIGSLAFDMCLELTEISLPDSVDYIGNKAFDNCNSLTFFRIPNGVTQLYAYTLEGCTSMVSLTIPKSLVSIESYTFNCTDNIANVYYEGTAEDKANISMDSLTSATWHYSYGDSCSHEWETGYCTVTEPTTTTVGEGSCGCKYCYAKKSVEIPVLDESETANAPCGDNLTWTFDDDTGVLTISGTGSMYDFSYGAAPWAMLIPYISSVVIEEGVTSIGDSAFTNSSYYYSTITALTLPSTLTYIASWAFSSVQITNVFYNGTESDLEMYGFKSIYGLDSSTWYINAEPYSEDGFTYAVKDGKAVVIACDSSKTGKVIIPATVNGNTVTGIGSNTFQNFTNITEVVLPDTITEIGDRAFLWCTGLYTINFPSSLKSIGEWAFFYCTSLQGPIEIPDGVTEISYACFCDCSSLQTITLPSSVTKISGSAFRDSGIRDVYYGSCDKSALTVDELNDPINNATWHLGAHSMTKIAANAATCTDDGNNEYYYCSSCEKYFKDEAGRTETTVAAEVIAAHHSLTKVSATTATCTDDGNKEYFYCSGCKKYFKDDAGTTETTLKDETITAIGHNMTKTVAKAATCTEDGNNEYYYCSNCEKYFKDEAGTTQTSVADEVIAATGHSMTKTVAKAATCTEDGNNEYYYCSNCEKYFKDEAGTTQTSVADEVIAATGHSMTKTVAKAATCTEDGNNEYYYCSNCEKYFKEEAGTTQTSVADEVITAKGHEYVNHDGKAATCTENGWEAYQTCANCEYTSYKVIEAKGHDYVDHEAKAATCTENGWEAYQTCNNCDYTTYVEISATGHNWGEWTDGVRACQNEGCVETEKCAHDGVKAGETCPTCGTQLAEQSFSFSGLGLGAIIAVVGALVTLIVTFLVTNFGSLK